MLDTPRLLRFLAVSRVLSFRGAAQALGVDQPWLSRQVRQLESDLGFQLLTRTTRSVALTAEGEAVAAIAATLERATARAEAELSGLKREHDLVIRLGSHPFIYWWDGLRRLQQHFAQDAPAGRIETTSGLSARHLGRLTAGSLDAAFVILPPGGLNPTFDCMAVLKVRPHLLLPLEHPLVRRGISERAALLGLRIAVAPPGRDRSDFDCLYGAIFEAGAQPVFIPDGPTAVSHHAATDRLAMISLRAPDAPAPAGFIRVPIEAASAITVGLARHSRDQGLLNRFWNSARRTFGRELETP